MIDQNDLDFWIGTLKNTTMTRREIEHNLRDAGLSRNQARIVAATCRKSGSDLVQHPIVAPYRGAL